VYLSLVVWTLFAVACACPAARPVRENQSSILGVTALAWGWVPPYTIAWSANLWLLLGWVFLLCEYRRAACSLGGLAVLAGLSSWWLVRLPPLVAWPMDLLVGYYLWQACLLVFFSGSLALPEQAEPRTLPPDDDTWTAPSSAEVEEVVSGRRIHS
jgi:hypothetical protein